MDIDTILFYLLGGTSLLYLLHLGFYLVGASLYDVWQSSRLYRLTKSNRLQRFRPTVTVLVPAHNEEKVIKRCLDSIFTSQYQNFEVIVVDDASTDNTWHMLQQYVVSSPSAKLRIVSLPENVGKGGALNYILGRYVTTELVMMLDADSTISSRTIERAVSYFLDPRVVGVAANVQIKNEHTTLSVLQKFEHMISYRAKKAYSLTNCEFVIGGVASTYRMATIQSVGFYDTDTMTEDISLSMKVVALGNKDHRIVYASDVAAMTEPVENLPALFRQRYRWKYGSLQNIYKHRYIMDSYGTKYSSMLTTYRLPMAIVTEITLLFLPLVWIFVVSITFEERSLLLITGAYLTITAYVLLTLWLDENLRWRERLYLTVYVPLVYWLFYIMDVIQVIAVLKCLLKTRTLRRPRQVGTTWISPPRLGGHMAMQPIDHTRLEGK